MRHAVVLMALSGLLVSACGSGVDAFAIIASAPGSVGVGEQRVLVSITDQETGEGLAAPELKVVATLRDRIGSPLAEADGEFVWIVPDVRGLYSFRVDIPGPGTFQLTLDSDEFGEMGPVGLVTVADPAVVSIGDAAPPSETRTSPPDELDEITTDDDPDPGLYELTIAEAVDLGPSVIVFGTPAWCTSQACGPLLDQVKRLSAAYPNLNFVHVEVYENLDAKSAEDLILVPSVIEWGLPSEPWVFVTDARGVVSARFEGAASDRELAVAFAQASG